MKKGWRHFVNNHYKNVKKDNDINEKKLMNIFAQHFDIQQISKNLRIEKVFSSSVEGYYELLCLIRMEEDTAEHKVCRLGKLKGDYLIALQAMMANHYADVNGNYKKTVLMEAIKGGLIKMRYNAWNKFCNLKTDKKK